MAQPQTDTSDYTLHLTDAVYADLDKVTSYLAKHRLKDQIVEILSKYTPPRNADDLIASPDHTPNMITLTLPRALHDSLQDYATRHDVPMTRIITNAITQFVARNPIPILVGGPVVVGSEGASVILRPPQMAPSESEAAAADAAKLNKGIVKHKSPKFHL